jgi:molybdate transport system substrate-binding protein
MNVLSAGAVQRAVESAARAFQEETGAGLSLSFATAPVIRTQVEGQQLAFDSVIAPLELMRRFEQQRLIASGSSVTVGSVKAGVAVCQGDWQPDISSAATLKQELIACDAIVYTEGSSGIFAEELIERLGIGEVVKEKTTRLADAAAAMRFLASSKTGQAIGFGQVTAILLHAGKGVKLVGALPKGVESMTTYAAGTTTTAEAPELAQRFVSFLVMPPTRAAFQAAGVE